MALGKNQLRLLAKMSGLGMAVVVGDKMMRGLSAKGMVVPLGNDGDSFFTVTPSGLRAVADALDSGRLPTTTIDDFKPKGKA